MGKRQEKLPVKDQKKDRFEVDHRDAVNILLHHPLKKEEKHLMMRKGFQSTRKCMLQSREMIYIQANDDLINQGNSNQQLFASQSSSSTHDVRCVPLLHLFET